METAEAPRSWQEAFQNNSIVAVRTIERQLGASVSRDKERLRALVGGNYRELLSTAEEIVSLDSRTRNTESQISQLSKQCKPPQQQIQPRPVTTNSSAAAQLRLFNQCIASASTALQARKVLLCAQLTVVARLLLKSTTESSSPLKSIDHLGNKIASLRRRLLRLIDIRLCHPSSDVDALVQAICAYCLITSTSSGDAVKHYREARLERLRQRTQNQERGPSQIREDFRYLVKSMTCLRSLLGRSVNDSLTLLQRQPILQDHNISRLETLDFDLLSGLVPQEILAFTPYIKRVLLKKDEIQQISYTWANDAGQVFVDGLNTILANIQSIGDIFTLRKDLLSVILPSFFTAQLQEVLLEKVREATNSRVSELCERQVGGLIPIGRDMVSVDKRMASNPSLWAPSLVLKTPSNNGNKYAEEVQTNHLGLKSGLGAAMKKLKRWARETKALQDRIDALTSTRWQDLLEEPDDEDEAVAKRILSQLSKSDPTHFQNITKTCLQSTFTQFNELMQSAVTEAVSDQEIDTGSNVTRITHLLRALRESTAILTLIVPDSKMDATPTATKLHAALAERIIRKINLTPDSLSSGRTIAAGLEDLPSVQAFKLLRDICKAMTDEGGTDVWSAAAVSIFKDKLRSRILDGEGKASPSWNDFDSHYIGAALGVSETLVLDAPSKESKSKAIAYWHRTRLLFGPLA